MNWLSLQGVRSVMAVLSLVGGQLAFGGYLIGERAVWERGIGCALVLVATTQAGWLLRWLLRPVDHDSRQQMLQDLAD